MAAGAKGVGKDKVRKSGKAMSPPKPRNAEDLASQHFLAGTINATTVEETLNTMRVQVNHGRRTLSDEHHRTMVLGMYSYGGKVGISSATKRLPNVTKMLASFAQTQCPGFAFTSIVVNEDVLSQPHCDQHNLGASLIIGLGNYTGGALCYHDDKASTSFKLTKCISGRPDYPKGMQCPIFSVNIKNQWFEFDGNRMHFTKEFQGKRYTLVYFVCDKYLQCDPPLRMELRGHGFNFLFTNPQLQQMRTKVEIRKDCPIQLVLREVLKLKAYCLRTAMGGGYKLKQRGDHPNGSGFSGKFRSWHKRIQRQLAFAPLAVQNSVKKDMLLMQTPSNGGQFNSKTRALYMEPLRRLESTLRRHA